MARILKKPLAEADLIDIWQFIAQDNPQKADQFFDRIEELLQSLAKMPTLGRK